MRHGFSDGAAWEKALHRDGEGTSRAGFLRRVGLLAGSALAGGALAAGLPAAARSASIGRDVQILNYVLRLEALKAAFYSEAASRGGLSGELHQLAEVLARQERVHVSFLRNRLGGVAEPERMYDFGDAVTDEARFSQTAYKLEEAAVAAYIGEGPNLSSSLMVPFAQMCSVEARHAAWIADVLQKDPAPRPADRASAPADVLALLRATGFETTSS
jgi:hypothetical protein